MSTFQVSQRNVNTPRLANEIIKIMKDFMDCPYYLVTNDVHRSSVIETTKEWMSQLLVTSEIDNFKIIGDHRINSQNQLNKGVFVMEMQYKEHNCVNLTKLRVEMRVEMEKSFKF